MGLDSEIYLKQIDSGNQIRTKILNSEDSFVGFDFSVKNKIDVSYRDIQNVDNQWLAMSYILDCLTDNQLKIAQKLINEIKKKERN